MSDSQTLFHNFNFRHSDSQEQLRLVSHSQTCQLILNIWNLGVDGRIFSFNVTVWQCSVTLALSHCYTALIECKTCKTPGFYLFNHFSVILLINCLGLVLQNVINILSKLPRALKCVAVGEQKYLMSGLWWRRETSQLYQKLSVWWLDSSPLSPLSSFQESLVRLKKWYYCNDTSSYPVLMMINFEK